MQEETTANNGRRSSYGIAQKRTTSRCGVGQVEVSNSGESGTRPRASVGLRAGASRPRGCGQRGLDGRPYQSQISCRHECEVLKH
jgi:hypothetical protein